ESRSEQASTHGEGPRAAAVEGMAEEKARVDLGHDCLDARRVQRDGRVLARRAAAEVLPGHDDLVRRHELVVRVKWNVALRQTGLSRRHAAKCVLAELLVFLGNGRVVSEVLRWNDL